MPEPQLKPYNTNDPFIASPQLESQSRPDSGLESETELPPRPLQQRRNFWFKLFPKDGGPVAPKYNIIRGVIVFVVSAVVSGVVVGVAVHYGTK